MIKVAKFGGSSVANADQFRKVKHIVESDPQVHCDQCLRQGVA